MVARLAAAARERGIQRFEAKALAENLALRDVLAQLGPGVNVRREDDELVTDAELPDVPVDALADAHTRAAAHHRFLSLAARGLVAVQRIFSKLEHVATL